MYGRLLAYLFVDRRLVNHELLRRGHANVHTVPRNIRYDELFRQEERQARQEEVGLWDSVDVGVDITRIEADAPGNDNEDPNGEWIEITNRGTVTVDVIGRSLKDEANHLYTFGPFHLVAGCYGAIAQRAGRRFGPGTLLGVAGSVGVEQRS